MAMPRPHFFAPCLQPVRNLCPKLYIKDKSLDEKVSLLHIVLNEGITRFVPCTKRNHFKIAWYTKELQNLKNRRNKEWKRFRLTGDKSSYDSAFTSFDALNSTLYQNHVNKLKSSLKQNPSSFWNLVNSKRKVNCLPKLLHDGS